MIHVINFIMKVKRGRPSKRVSKRVSNKKSINNKIDNKIKKATPKIKTVKIKTPKIKSKMIKTVIRKAIKARGSVLINIPKSICEALKLRGASVSMRVINQKLIIKKI